VFVPETLALDAVWTALEAKHQYMATVFDEYGGTAGIITIEDLLEEIFGELQDEFDSKENALVSADKTGRLFLRGELLVEDVNEYLTLGLPEQEMDTLGGLVFEALGRRPRVGDEVTLGVPGISVRVESIDELAVLEVSLLLGPKVQTQVGEWAVAVRD
jgi:CBS domain containing-hemolysin-like protein